MTNKEKEALGQFLGGTWYDRPEDDATIIKEFVSEASPACVAEQVQLIQNFLNSPESVQAKSEFIRKEVWLYFPDEEGVPLKWLTGVLSQLERANRGHGDGEQFSAGNRAEQSNRHARSNLQHRRRRGGR